MVEKTIDKQKRRKRARHFIPLKTEEDRKALAHLIIDLYKAHIEKERRQTGPSAS